jgi:hypothetical protein
MTTQPEALRLADELEMNCHAGTQQCAAAELRRLHAVNQELLEALKHYADTYCEGWCKESCGSFDDCGGCKARAAIAKAEAAA